MLPPYETISHRIDGQVAILTLNRPESLNAMNMPMFADLKAAFEAIADRPDIRAVVLAGEGRHFTAGLDLKEAAGSIMESGGDPARNREQFYRHVRYLQDCLTAIELAPQPVIAAIHGGCIGGGVDMVSACCLRIAAEDSFFTVQEIEVGLVADIGTLQRLPKLIPLGVVRELAYTGRRYSAQEALNHGFVNATAPDRAAVLQKAEAMAQDIARKTPLAITGIKKVINHARDNNVTDGLDYVATWNSGMLMGEDIAKAIQASLSKTPAEFADRLAKK